MNEKALPYLCREGYCPYPEHTSPDRKYVGRDGIIFIEEEDEDYDPVASLLDKLTYVSSNRPAVVLHPTIVQYLKDIGWIE